MRTDIVPAEIAQHFAESTVTHPLSAIEIAPRSSALSKNALTARHRGFAFRPLDIALDMPLLHRWFIDDRATFWNMQDKSVAEVSAFYQARVDSGHARAHIGLENDVPAFLIECYDPAHDEVGEHYDVLRGDMGMHLFVAPASTPRHGYTRHVFTALMTFIFETLDARRVVVEPDTRNTRIHALNRAMGFVYANEVSFREKTASLAFCTRENFQAAIQKENLS